MAGNAMLLLGHACDHTQLPIGPNAAVPSVFIDTCRRCYMFFDRTFIVIELISCNSASPAGKSRIISKPQTN